MKYMVGPGVGYIFFGKLNFKQLLKGQMHGVLTVGYLTEDAVTVLYKLITS